MIEISEKYAFYISLGLGVFALAAVASSGQVLGILLIPFLLLAIFFPFLAFVLFKYGYWIMPFIMRGARVIEIREGFEIPPSQDVVLKKSGNSYLASIFLLVKIYESVTEKTEEEKAIFMEYFERAISSLKFVAKFCMMVYVKDIAKYRESIEVKRAEAQIKLGKEREKAQPNLLVIDRQEREIAMWNGMLEKLTTGEKPMGAVSYIMTTGAGVTKESAIAAARAQANEIRSTIANALNVQVIPLTGEDMRRCLEWEMIIPPTSKDLESQVS